MSLYALPGPLFAPIEFPGCSKKQQSFERIGTGVQNTSSPPPSCNSRPPTSRVLFDNSLIFTDLPSRQDPPRYVTVNLKPDKMPVIVEAKTGERKRAAGVQKRFISVQDVKIDPERLVKSLTSTKRPDPSTTHSTGMPAVQSDFTCIPHEQAVEFVLSVSFNGRQYSTTRSMRRIFQFRKSLLEEVQNYEQWISQKLLRRKQRQEITKNDKLKTDDDLQLVIGEANTRTLQIPPLPTLLDSSPLSDGIFVRGFARFLPSCHGRMVANSHGYGSSRQSSFVSVPLGTFGSDFDGTHTFRCIQVIFD